MLTRKHYNLQAKALGTYVIPMCIEYDSNSRNQKWNASAIEKFHALGTYLVDFFRSDNPNFDLEKFNTTMLSHALTVEPFRSKYRYLIQDFPGMRLRGTQEHNPHKWNYDNVHTYL